ncbi:MAG TPA: hypothetical protein VGY57_04730 [Vicinamibacterales bacterium]|jgi:hypothetical protein|nr:hypothetical protein [Vicinamibacterales bacterium]
MMTVRNIAAAALTAAISGIQLPAQQATSFDRDFLLRNSPGIADTKRASVDKESF